MAKTFKGGKMKALILKTILMTLLITTSSYASYGGIVESKGKKLYAECIQYDEEVCIELEIYEERETGSKWLLKRILMERIDNEELAKRGYKVAGNALKNDYWFYSYYGTVLGTYAALNVLLVGIVALVGGFVADVVKAPVMLIGFGVHKLTDKMAKKRLKKLIKHILDPAQ